MKFSKEAVLVSLSGLVSRARAMTEKCSLVGKVAASGWKPKNCGKPAKLENVKQGRCLDSSGHGENGPGAISDSLGNAIFLECADAPSVRYCEDNRIVLCVENIEDLSCLDDNTERSGGLLSPQFRPCAATGAAEQEFFFVVEQGETKKYRIQGRQTGEFLGTTENGLFVTSSAYDSNDEGQTWTVSRNFLSSTGLEEN